MDCHAACREKWWLNPPQLRHFVFLGPPLTGNIRRNHPYMLPGAGMDPQGLASIIFDHAYF